MDEKVIGELTEAIEALDASRLLRSGIVLLAMILIFIIISIVKKHYRKHFDFSDDVRRRHAFNNVFRVIRLFVAVIAVLVILQINGFNISTLATGLALLVVVIVLAVKDSFQDIFAGFVILLDKYFKVGDAVEFDGRDGIVVFFNIRTTKIEFLDDRSVISVANRNISKIRKLTHLVDVDLSLSYDADRKTVYTALTDICRQIGQIEGVESCEFKGTQDFGDSAIIYKIRFFCEPNDRPDIRRAVIKTIQDGLAEAGLTIAYPQLDIHTK